MTTVTEKRCEIIGVEYAIRGPYRSHSRYGWIFHADAFLPTKTCRFWEQRTKDLPADEVFELLRAGLAEHMAGAVVRGRLGR